MNESLIQSMDKEWVALILEAKNLGLTKAEVQTFLRTSETKAFETVVK